MPASVFLNHSGRNWQNPDCSFYLSVSMSREPTVLVSDFSYVLWGYNSSWIFCILFCPQYQVRKYVCVDSDLYTWMVQKKEKITVPSPVQEKGKITECHIHHLLLQFVSQGIPNHNQKPPSQGFWWSEVQFVVYGFELLVRVCFVSIMLDLVVVGLFGCVSSPILTDPFICLFVCIICKSDLFDLHQVQYSFTVHSPWHRLFF